MRKPPPPEHCDYATPASRGVRGSLDGLAHFHVEHSDNRFADVFTKEVTASPTAPGVGALPSERQVIIVLASDPAVVAAVVEALKPFLPTLTVELPEPPPPPKPSIQ